MTEEKPAALKCVDYSARSSTGCRWWWRVNFEFVTGLVVNLRLHHALRLRSMPKKFRDRDHAETDPGWTSRNVSQVLKADARTKTSKERVLRYAALVMAPPAWLSTITGVSNQLISGSAQ